MMTAEEREVGMVFAPIKYLGLTHVLFGPIMIMTSPQLYIPTRD